MYEDLARTQEQQPLERWLWSAVIPSILLTAVMRTATSWRAEDDAPGTRYVFICSFSWLDPPSGVPDAGWLVDPVAPRLDELPERLSGPLPQYPETLRKAGLEGRVLVEAIIDTNGRAIPSSVRVMTHSSLFDQPAINVVLHSLFRPGRVSGRPVATRVIVPVHFVLHRD